jgi:hypothetical protein
LLGLVVGAVLGCLLAFLLGPPGDPDIGWTSYPTLANPNGAVFGQFKTGEAAARAYYFNGILFGGGFGSVIGGLVGGTGAILRALNRPRSPPI